MEAEAISERIAEAVRLLRSGRASFAYLHGSQASGMARVDSDIDIAAFFGNRTIVSSDFLLPTGVDLLVLDAAPLEIAGTVAARGRLLFEDDPAIRVRWEATMRKIYFDERPRLERAHREFLKSVTRG